MKKKDLIKFIIIGVVILGIFILVIVLLGNNKSEDSNIKLNKTSNNYVVDDDISMNLYYRYSSESELLFNVVGSSSDKDNYAYYYRKNKVTYDDLNDTIKNTILFNDADYKSGEYDNERNCYYMTINSFKTIYKKLFGHDDYNIEFGESFNPKVYVDDKNLCIGTKENNDYTSVIDTYMVNVVKNNNYITIYERVAFIDIDDEYLYFYKDYEMKDLVYKLKLDDKLDWSFINNSQVVSNVLLKYQDEFVLYEYTYVVGEDSYYLESIAR